ncbi:MAG TPA: AsmA-like C-terminal region-containing protein [Sumerlaeia bacterium]|nr:AsmA-like C-terminal region-containing protein [Sumerlaeia bacterium]
MTSKTDRPESPDGGVSPPSTPPTTRRRRRPRILIGFGVCFLVFFTVLYLYVSSRAFFSQWIQPRLEKRLGRSIEIGSYDFSPLGSLRLREVRIAPLPDEDGPPLHLGEMDLRFQPASLLRGRIVVKRLLVDALSVRVVRDEQGKLIGPFPRADKDQATQGPAKPGEKQARAGSRDARTPGPQEATRFLSRLFAADVNLKNLNALYEERLPGDEAPVRWVKIESFSLACPRLAMNEDWEIKGGGILKGQWPESAESEAASQAGEPRGLSGRVDISVVHQATNGKPGAITSRFGISRVEGEFRGQQLENFSAVLEPRIEMNAVDNQGAASPTPSAPVIRLLESSMTVRSGDAVWARTDFSGRFSLADRSGELRMKVHPLDRRLLNLLPPSHRGLDFRHARVSAEGGLTLAPGATPAEVHLQASVDDFDPTGNGLPEAGFPATSASFDLALQMLPEDQPVLLKTFALEVMQGGRKIATGGVAQPLPFDRSTFLPVVDKVEKRKALIALTLHDVDAVQWAPFLPAKYAVRLEQGVVRGNVALAGDPDSTGTLFVIGDLRAENFKGSVSGRAFDPYTLGAAVRASVDRTKRLTLDRCGASLYSGDKRLAQCAATGNLLLGSWDGDLKMTLDNVELESLPLAILSRVGLTDPGGLEVRDGYVRGEAAVTLASPPQRIGLSTDLRLGGLHLARRDGAGKPLEQVDAALTARASLVRGDQGLQRIDLPSLSLSARVGGRPFVTASAEGSLDVEGGQGKIVASCVDFDLLPIFLLQGSLPDKAMPTASNLNSRLEVSMKNPKTVLVSGHARLEPLAFKGSTDSPNATIALPVAANLQMSAFLDEKRLKIEECRIAAGDQQDRQGNLKIDGQIRYGESVDGELTLRAEEFRLLPFAPLAPAVAEKVDLAEAVLGGSEALNLSGKEEQTAVAKGALVVAKLRPAGAKDESQPRLSVTVNNEILYAAKTMDLTKLQIDLTHEGQTPDRIDCVGALHFGKERGGKFRVTSKALRLQPLLGYAGMTPAPDAPPLTAENLETDVVVAGPVVTLENFQARLAGGAIACPALSIDRSAGPKPLIRCRDLKGEKLDVAALVANLAPDRAGQIEGTGECDATGSAGGVPKDRTLASLRGSFRCRVRDGRLSGIPLTRELAAVTRIPELADIVFLRFDTEITAAEQSIIVQGADIEGPQQKIRLQGQIDHDENLDLAMTLALGGKLKERILEEKYARYLKTDAGGYLAFPTPLGVSGTLSKPKITLKFPSDSVLDLGTSILEEELKKRQEKKEKKKDDGEKTPTDSGEEKSGKDERRELLEQLGGELLKGLQEKSEKKD